MTTVQRFAAAPVTEDDLFWGALGGNAGSFGVVTNDRFDWVRDADLTPVLRYTVARVYRQHGDNSVPQPFGIRPSSAPI